jgi:hypothetical protein
LAAALRLPLRCAALSGHDVDPAAPAALDPPAKSA